jgi:hypothetical protein
MTVMKETVISVNSSPLPSPRIGAAGVVRIVDEEREKFYWSVNPG